MVRPFRAVCIAGFVLLLAQSSAIAGDAGIGTFSIVAFDPVTMELGVAVQSRAFGVGAAVAWAEAGVGAIATQASTNESFGPRGLDLLRSGNTSKEVLELLLDSDEERQDRQVAVIDTDGLGVNFTGSRCLDWAGGITGETFACQGNILVSEEVVKAMAAAFEETGGELSEKLLATLVAAQAAGGDKRGMQSAAILVVRPSEEYPEYNYRYVDLRVEDHTDPINELIRVYRIHEGSDLLRAHIRYAEHYDELGEEEMAARERGLVGGTLKRVLSEDAADADLLNNLAWFCATADIFVKQAVEAAERAVALRPEDANILDTLAEAYFRDGRAAEAVATIERAIEIDPESSYFREQLERFKAP
jgi:uncharacterized Ntn-hydrolase superfamily protein